MSKTKFGFSILLIIAVLAVQVGNVLAAPRTQEGFITGSVTALACETDITTGIVTFLVTVDLGDGTTQTVRIDQATAEELELIYLNEDGSPDCSEEALAESIGWEVSIDPAVVIPDEEEDQHPVGGALATFFEDIADYDTIMEAHDNGFGFGVIAQALWMVQKIEGSDADFLAILEAKKSGDYSALGFEDVSNWGQFRRTVLGGEKGNLGIVMSGNNGNGNGNGQGNGNGNGQGNGNNGNHGNGNNGNGNGNGNGNNGNGRDK